MDASIIWNRIISPNIIDNLLASLIFLLAQTIFITIGLGLIISLINKRRNKPIVGIFLKRFYITNDNIANTLSSLKDERQDVTELFYQMSIYHTARLKEIITLQTSSISSVAATAYEYISDCEYMLLLIQHIIYAKRHPNELAYIEYPEDRFNRMIKFQRDTTKHFDKKSVKSDIKNEKMKEASDIIRKLSHNIPNISYSLSESHVKQYDTLVVLDRYTIQNLHVPDHINSIRTTVGYAA